MTATTCPPTFAALIEDIAEARRRASARGRWRSFVARIDAVIDACERAHLNDEERPGPTLATWGGSVLRSVAAALAERGEAAAHAAVLEVSLRPQGMIVDLMDALWAAQDVVLDLLIPRRRVLADAIGAAPGDRGVAA